MSGDILQNADTGRARALGETADGAAPDCANRGMASICCELYGVPRLRAGTARVEVEGNTVGEALADLLRHCPAPCGKRSGN